MNPLKAEMKMGVLHDVGVRMDDKLDEANRRLYAHGGAKQALRIVAKNISALAELVKKDMDNEDLPVEQLKVAEYVNKMISRACEMCIGAAQHQENLEITAQGAVQAYEEVVAALKKDIDQEETKLKNYQEAMAEAEVDVEGVVSAPDARSRPAGMRPGMSIAAQRKAEAEAEKAEAEQAAPEKPQEASEEPQEASAAEEPEAEAKPKKRRRGRSKKKE